VGDGEKLLTYLNSALKVLSGLDMFPRGTKKKLNFVDLAIDNYQSRGFITLFKKYLLLVPIQSLQNALRNFKPFFGDLIRIYTPISAKDFHSDGLFRDSSQTFL
jgi:hypothetical protein